MTESATTVAQTVAQLNNRIDTILSPYVPASKKFALLGHPQNSNAGDHAIWLGAINYFRNVHQAVPAYVDKNDDINGTFEKLHEIHPEGVIFVTGGGNLNDFYDPEVQYRVQILRKLPNHKIIQLPETIKFNDVAKLNYFADAVGRHRDYTLLARDAKSLAFAQKHFNCESILCPDMAFCLGLLSPSRPVSQELQIFLRNDVESTVTEKIKAEHEEYVAQAKTFSVSEQQFAQRCRVLRPRAGMLVPFKLGLKGLNRLRRREFLYRYLSEYQVNDAIARMSRSAFLIADSLHAHVLALLLQKPHIILDTNQRKISDFYDTWTRGSESVWDAQDLNHALDQYQKLKQS